MAWFDRIEELPLQRFQLRQSRDVPVTSAGWRSACMPRYLRPKKKAIACNVATGDSNGRDYGTLTEAGAEKALSPLCESTAVTA